MIREPLAPDRRRAIMISMQCQPSIHFEVLDRLAPFGVREVFTFPDQTGLVLMVDPATSWERVAELAREAKREYSDKWVGVFDNAEGNSKPFRWSTDYVRRYGITNECLAQLWGVPSEVTKNL